MNTFNFKTLCIFIFLFFMAGCYAPPIFSIITKVNLDGSCERTLIAKNMDSDELVSENFPISIDSTWEMTIQVDTVLKKDCDTVVEKVDTTYFFNKTFQNVEELNKEYADTSNNYALLNRSIEFQKKFRWFYTFFEYTETFGKMFEGKPMNAYLSEEELSALDSDTDSIPLFEGLDSIAIKQKKDSIDEKYEEWISNTFFNAYFNALYKSLLRDEHLQKYADTLLNIQEHLVETYKISEIDIDSLITTIDMQLNTNGEILNLLETDSSILIIDNLVEICWGFMIFEEEGFHYTLILPGELTTTNADSISNDTLQYIFTWEEFFTEDYEMKAQTRIINHWAFYVSGAIVLLAIIALLVGRRKR